MASALSTGVAAHDGGGSGPAPAAFHAGPFHNGARPSCQWWQQRQPDSWWQRLPDLPAGAPRPHACHTPHAPAAVSGLLAPLCLLEGVPDELRRVCGPELQGSTPSTVGVRTPAWPAGSLGSGTPDRTSPAPPGEALRCSSVGTTAPQAVAGGVVHAGGAVLMQGPGLQACPAWQCWCSAAATSRQWCGRGRWATWLRPPLLPSPDPTPRCHSTR